MMHAVRRMLARNWIGALSVLSLVAAWEIAAHLVPVSPLQGTPIVPSLEHMLGVSFIGMSDYWKFPFWAPVPELGGAQTYRGAILAMSYHSLITLYRISAGMLLGASVGVTRALLLAHFPLFRALAAGPLHFLRMCPLLAMIPLFQFWFGATDKSVIIFVAYGVGVVYLVTALNAIANLPHKYIEAALCQGASRLRILRSIVIPAILPEFFSAIYVTLGIAWSAVVAAEYIGVDSGIGRMVIWADYFSDTGRMMIVTLFILAYAMLTFAFVRILQRYVLRWMP
ncbi:ABC transporter permease subunit [Ancylobacter sp. A5.8]|uniref:ABC transporter permease n=1 Tax=Ancylobacter gelatini TaxID=2919920 RepID=UPI001F4DDABE|nr:ABC transporter permease subunit [Ancylobacter gelatini]MCJ8142343.1 ABC transporter permease subunit [Ancylobacter gelatini]